MVEKYPPRPKIVATAHKRPQRVQKMNRPAAAAPPPYSLARMIGVFSACARCSFFFTGYRALYLDEQVQQEVAKTDNVWLTLRWSHQVAELIHQSFGRNLTNDLVKYQFCCLECMRLYNYETRENEIPVLLVQLDPQKH